MSAIMSSPSSAIRASACSRTARHHRGRALLPTPARLSKVAPSRAMTMSEAKTVVEVTAETLHSYLENSSAALTVVDFYTTWCGPCKLVAPEVDRMCQEFGNVSFAKFDCGAKDNQAFAVGLGIKALPTFQLYRGSQKVAEMTGAKAEQLRRLVTKQLQGDNHTA